jgi:hypothetical protein
MQKPIADLVAGDVLAALVHPGGRCFSIRGGPLEVASTAPTGGQRGHPQI